MDGPRRECTCLRVAEVEVGLRGAFRRVFKGVLPRARLESISRKFAARAIPWQFVDVIEPDPARRVKLRIEHERLADIHPSDLADILEDLAPAEREAVFTSLDEEVAAETLEEVEPKLQKALLEKLDDERIADIVEEMDPGAAADLLSELPEDQSDAILEEMEPEERQEVEELLEFDENSAAGCMTTEFVYLGADATVAQAVQALRSFDGDPETVTEVYLLDEKRVLRGAVPLARLVMAQPETRLSVLAEPRVLSCPADMNQNELAEMFDKYNLHALPVVDCAGPHGGRGQRRAGHQLPARKALKRPDSAPGESGQYLSQNSAHFLYLTICRARSQRNLSESVKQFKDAPVSKNYSGRHGCRRLQLAPGPGRLKARPAWAWSRARHSIRFLCAGSPMATRAGTCAGDWMHFRFRRWRERIWQEYFVPGGKPAGRSLSGVAHAPAAQPAQAG